ncbi:CBS domain-containing protein [Oryzobacter sp. R7]|uniref:CBS domain-containing protein n=1 Tax=Oryzobacter faecalis TaxID=3388656 RepID=UPI00398CD46F
MTTARDVMTTEVEMVGEDDTLADAARRMADLDVGSLPICSADQRLVGVVTDRDIVVRAVAEGRDPSSVAVKEVAQGEAVTIGADDSLEEARAVMADHQVRRLPVIDGDRVVGIISQADVARASADADTGEVVQRISE